MKEKAIGLFEKANVNLSKIRFFIFDYADVWFRDYGPIFVRRGQELAMVHWKFNSWGEKYEELLKDAQIPNLIGQEMKLQCFEPGIV